MRHITIGITQGDINSVGFEVIMKVLAESKIYEGKTFIVYGSPKAAAYHKKSLDLPNFNFNVIASASEALPKRANMIDCVGEEVSVDAGMATQEAGKYAMMALHAGFEDLKNNKIDVLITMPVNKDSIQKAGIVFQGHTSFFGKAFNTTQHTDLFVNDAIKTCYVSSASQLFQVVKSITKDAVLEKIVALNDSLRVDFGISKPKIAVLALNAVLGDEDAAITKAVEEAKNSGFMTVGPYTAEKFFATAEYKNFDGVIGMYRDQVVTPFKALSYDDSYLFSMGLPKICVSPQMSLDYANVGKNNADESPLLCAIYSAYDLLKQREEYAELIKNQLK
ncbi:MAG: 4-hydroxythreonine-4-phosphate dehydrogenase PdxA [Bacteroidales bacterium]|nr:4-hydroxythreonine-4-phosphate dehydrogenase PdxA [Bacteroidales bacterium]